MSKEWLHKGASSHEISSNPITFNFIYWSISKINFAKQKEKSKAIAKVLNSTHFYWCFFKTLVMDYYSLTGVKWAVGCF